MAKGAQKPPQPAQEKGEVVSGGGQHGVGTIAIAALEVIAVPAVLGFEVADDRLDRGAAFHLAADRSGHPPHLAGHPDAEFVRMIVAAIALVDMDAVGLNPGELFQFGDNRPKAGPKV